MKKEDLLLEEWKIATELHRHTDNMAWQALNFFIATNGVLITILGAIVISDKFSQNNPAPLIVAVAIPLIGTITSSLWGFIQIRQQLYQYYRGAQARQVEEALKIDGERILTLYEKNLNEQELVTIPKFRRYLKSRIGNWRAHTLVTMLGFFLAIVWFLLLAFFVVYAILKLV